MLNRMKTLIAQLLKANAAYYGKDDPIMTDQIGRTSCRERV